MSFSEPVLVIGHRGAAGLEPENTLSSFRRAYALGVSAIELDLYCVDGALLVIHDDTLERTTSGKGKVMAQSLGSLRALDAGGGQQIPLLEEVFAELPDGVGINLELKGRGTAEPTARFLTRAAAADVLVSSFDHSELGRFHALAPGVAVAPLQDRWRATLWQTAAELDAWGVNVSRRIATPERLREAAARGLRTLIYTVNDLEEAQRLVAWGATGVFTDYPDRITPDVLGGRAPGSSDSGCR